MASTAPSPAPAQLVAVGQLARDLVLTVDGLPAAGGTAVVGRRRESLGGKGANQAVAAAQLGLRSALVAVAGIDAAADSLLAQATAENVDITHVVRRSGAATALVTEIVCADGQVRYLQDVPASMLLTPQDVAAAGALLAQAQAVLVQLQQPTPAALAAARMARSGGALVIMDGAPSAPDDRGPLLALADVVRANSDETRQLTGVEPDDPQRLRPAVDALLAQGLSLVALALHDHSNLFAWPGGQVVIPPDDARTVDPTGAGDAMTAALAAALLRGQPPEGAARFAMQAAVATIDHIGGHPDLDTPSLATS